MTIRYGSVCSGIEAATVAWHPLGWKPSFFSEIEAFPRAVLSHHYPTVPLHGDFTTIGANEYDAIDLLVGGTPCQSFSVAGLRGGLADDRGNLALEYLRLADRTRPRWLVWENVPGVLSSNGGRDFGAILGGMVELGYGFAYRVLDAQHFGVPQRRRRVFVVGYLGDRRPAGAVLFERHSLQGHSAPSRKAGKDVAGSLSASPSTGRSPNEDATLISMTLNAKGGSGRLDAESETFVTHSLRGEGFDASEDGTGRGTPLVSVIGFQSNAGSQGGDVHVEMAPTLRVQKAGGGGMPAVAFNARQDPTHGAVADPLGTKDTGHGIMLPSSAVRRLTPRECERLQGFPDDYTLVPHRGKPAADGPRYKALGNSMAVPVMRWIGERIQSVEEMQRGFRLEAAE